MFSQYSAPESVDDKVGSDDELVISDVASMAESETKDRRGSKDNAGLNEDDEDWEPNSEDEVLIDE